MSLFVNHYYNTHTMKQEASQNKDIEKSQKIFFKRKYVSNDVITWRKYNPVLQK